MSLKTFDDLLRKMGEEHLFRINNFNDRIFKNEKITNFPAYKNLNTKYEVNFKKIDPYKVDKPLRNLLDPKKEFNKADPSRWDKSYFERQSISVFGSVELATQLELFQEGFSIDSFGLEYLARNVKQKRRVSENELKKYGLEFDIQLPDNDYGRRFIGRFYDSQYNFCLTYNDGIIKRLVASIGFDLKDSRIVIRQIQGEKGRQEKLNPFKWPRAFVQYVIEWAKENGIPEVSITSVDNNHWAYGVGHFDNRTDQLLFKRGTGPLNYQTGKLLYDMTAKRLGFERDHYGNYRLRISSEAIPKVPLLQVSI